ncbi:MAG: cellulase family glycosylhydrolase [Candidatus Pacebacteria bacterium]|nr:cellulase family glycosylhydrolase [Candidatus Paceibacterota bacterium]
MSIIKNRKVSKKKIILILILFTVIISTIYFIYTPKREDVKYGVTFSKPFAEHLGLDWKETYLALLDDAGVKIIRLPSYWTEIEPVRNKYLFEDLDWQIDQAEKRDVKIIIVLGQKQPRWPECHIPKWAEKLNKYERQNELIEVMKKTVERYKYKENITAWQIENEPFLKYGECPEFDKNFLDREIALVRSLDSRPIIISDSGELGTWYSAAKRADILGTTLYRIVWNDHLGYVHYPIASVVYRIKAAIIMYITGVEKIIIVELQAEPWGPKMIIDTPLEEQYKSMSPEQFRENIEYVRKIEFSEAYLWGGEWWYWLKTKKGDDRIWEEAKGVFGEL